MPFRLMRLALASALIAAALAAVAPAGAAPARTTPVVRNLLLNPGFEKAVAGPGAWLPADWDSSESGVATVFFARDGAQVRNGDWAVSIANVSSYMPIAHYWGQALPVGREAWGRDLVLRVWTRSNGLSGRAYVAALVHRDTVGKMAKVWNVPRDEARERLDINAIDDPIMDVGWGRRQFTDANTEWVLREVRAHVPAGANMVHVRLGLIGTGQVVFDDASLTLEPARPVVAAVTGQDVLRDGDFEGNALDWELSLPPYDGAVAELDTTQRKSGRQSMRIAGGEHGLVSSRLGVCQSFPGRQLAGKRVRLSGWLRGDSLQTTCYLTMYATNPRGRAQSPLTEQYSGTFDWKYASLEWDVPKDAYLVWVWFIKTVPAPGTLWLDDAKFEVLGPSRPPVTLAPKPGVKKTSPAGR